MELVGREVLKVQALAGVFKYKEFSDEAGTIKSKMFGKEYRRFSYKSKVFTVESTHAFCTAWDNGEVYSIELTEDADYIEFAGHTTLQQEVKMAKSTMLLKSYTVENFIAGKLQPEEEIAI